MMGVPLCKSAMSRNQFCKILRFFRFDIKSNRLQKLQTNTFAVFCEICNRFINNCYTSYNQSFYHSRQSAFP